MPPISNAPPMTSLALTPPQSRCRDLAAGLFKIHPAVFQLIALIPVIWWFAKRLNDGSDEPLGLLTLGLGLVLAWRDRKSLLTSPLTRVAGAVLLALSVLGIHWLPPMVRAGLAISGIATWYGIHRHSGLMGLLMLSLPLAASMQFFLGYPLRVAAAEGTVRLLELGSLVVTRSGTQVELGGQVVGVDPACGGVRMLWHALAAAMALAAIHRLTWRATIIGGLFAIALVIPANVLRAMLLVVQECGRLPNIMLGHDGIGLASFIIVLLPLWLAISSRARPAVPATGAAPYGRTGLSVLAFSAALAPLLMFATPRRPGPPDMGIGPDVFTFDGLTLPLTPLPPSPAEMAFAESFPGTLASYQWGGSQVILRRVNEATRRLHQSRDCLRAAGFETTEALTIRLGDGTDWARFHAMRDGVRWTISERITSGGNGASWTDVSAWYWAAVRHPLNGPWQAETVITKS
ncbi:MAG: archaeosortase/exosortase family protein [Luteolibacter sp.]|uniref:archaeosortase/exosortase family protein n=1 Tax=Luteolibacter sp. TaxID=1962973 RepID=UPI0032650A90